MMVPDPIALIKLLWPDVTLYDKQRAILYSLWENDETFVPAGNMLGKDFCAGLGILIFFLSRHPCRVVTTSVDATQLNAVLWGEIRRFIQTSAQPLTTEDGGPLLMNNLHIRKVVNGQMCGLSYALGRVASDTGEGMLGHHIAKTGDGIPRTLFVADEASGVPDVYYQKADTWAHRKLVIGNCYPCENFFKHAVKGKPGTDDKGGDIPRVDGNGYYRKVIRIKATESPNVELGLLQRARGEKPTYETLLPGVKDFQEYEKNRLLWDPIKQCVSLDADFYEGAEIKMFPPAWLNRAEEIAAKLTRGSMEARAIGVDTAEGGDKSSWSVVGRRGLIKLISMQTPDTSMIPGFTIALAREFNVPFQNIMFDQGGGGKEHADRLRREGFPVRMVGFGETASNPQIVRRLRTSKERTDERETRYAYKNRRAEMYGLARQLLDPNNPDYPEGFGIPKEYSVLRQQLGPIPLAYDAEGRMVLPPKHKKDPKSNEVCLVDLIGHSPDEADSLVLGIFAMTHKGVKSVAGAV